MPPKLRSFFNFLLFLFFLSTFQISIADELLLEDYSQEDGSSGVFGTFRTIDGGTGGEVSFEASPPNRPGNTALKLETYHADVNDNDWGILHIKDFDSTLNVSDYQQLEFSFYSEGDDSIRSVAIQLYFEPGTTPDPDGENAWKVKEEPSLSEGLSEWKTVSVPLAEANFERSTAPNESNVFDLTQLRGIGVLISNNNAEDSDPSNEAPVYVDDIKVVSVSSTLSLDVETLDFGTLEPKPEEYRFESDIVTVDYAASNSKPWEIRIYTSNDNDASGLVNGSDNIPMKIDIGADGDASNDLNWSGDEGAGLEFLFVLDDSTTDGSGNPFYTKIASSNNGDPFLGSVQFNFAIDASGAPAGTYSAGIIVELFIED